MKRLVMTALLCTLGLLATAYGQTSTNPDKVFYYDKVKKDTSQTGKIVEESPSKITMDNKVSFPAADVKDVSYMGRLALDKRGKYGDALKAEENVEKAAAGAGKRTALVNAIAAYQAALPDVKSIPFAERHFAYKIAILSARLASEDPKERKGAIDLLMKFQKAHSDGWQITRATQRLADLQIASDDFKGATATLKVMEGMKGLPDDVKAAIPGRLVDVLISAKEFKEASAQIDKLLTGMKADSPEAFALKLKKFQVDGSVPGQLDKTVKQIDDMIKATKDSNRKQLAVCYNTKGQLLLTNNRAKEALYEFLYVDLIYNDDPAEQGKACAELAKLFDKIKQPARAKEYAEKAERLRK